MKVCAIMQPTYLPWAGYFNLIASADIFCFLDDAQLQKNSWHSRNQLLVNHTPHWISVPVLRNSLSQHINDTLIDATQPWQKKHVKLLQQTYGKHPFSDDVLSICAMIESANPANLAELNISIIRGLLEKLNIQTEILLTSSLGVTGKRTARLLELLKHLQVDCYLSPKGAKDYLEQDAFTDHTDIKLCYQDFNPVPYAQYQHQPFIGNLSIVDVVANIGWKASRQYIFQNQVSNEELK